MVVDCHGFVLRYNLDPRLLIGLAELLRQPYRDRLRLVLMVDAPLMIQPAWSIVHPLLPPATQRKFRFLSADEAVLAVEELEGAASASTLRRVMLGNRSEAPPKPQVPSDLAAILLSHWIQGEIEASTAPSISDGINRPPVETKSKMNEPRGRGFCHCRRRLQKLS